MSRGGKREGAGRPAGVSNKATADVKAVAETFTRSAVAVLASIMRDKAQPAAARVSAANTILDRAHGKAKQALEHSGPNGAPIAHYDLSKVTDADLDRLEGILGAASLAGGDQGGEGAAISGG